MTERLTEDYFDDMQKITRHHAKSNNIDLNTGGDDFQDIIDKLAKYETSEEEGRLVVLPCDTVYFICDKGTKYAHVRAKSIFDLLVYDINGIDKDGRYWSVKAEAEKALKENEGNDDRRALEYYEEVAMQELEKILEEIDAHAIEFEIFGTSDDYISVGWVKAIIRKHMNDGWIPVERTGRKGAITMTENQVSIKIPEEAIETIKSNMPTSGYQMLRESLEMAIIALKEVQKYREIGTVEECKELASMFTPEKKHVLGQIVDEWKEYIEIGTVEECRAAMEKQKLKKPNRSGMDEQDYYICPNCGADIGSIDDYFPRDRYCHECGQAIRWKNLEGMEDE